MTLTITRLHLRADGIFSTFVTDALNLVCLEHSYPDGKGGYAPKVPCGTYKAIRRMSPKFGYEVFCLQDVPECTDIEIHRGNYNDNSEGCFCLGTTIELGCPSMVTQSKVAFEGFMELCEGINEISIVVEK